jgi:hypothetical protein
MKVMKMKLCASKFCKCKVDYEMALTSKYFILALKGHGPTLLPAGALLIDVPWPLGDVYCPFFTRQGWNRGLLIHQSRHRYNVYILGDNSSVLTRIKRKYL